MVDFLTINDMNELILHHKIVFGQQILAGSSQWIEIF